MKRLSAVLVLAALAAVAGVEAAEVPPRVTVVYDVSHNGTVAVEATETLEHDAKTYRIASEWRGKGLYALARKGSAQRSSTGTIGEGGLRPNEFKDRRGDEPMSVARFDWNKHQLLRERDGKSESVPLPQRAQDRLSFTWGFMFAPPSGKDIEADVADTRGLSHLRYKLGGSERLHTPAGDFDALHLVKQREDGDARTTEIWLASKANYLPLRILVIEKDGTRIDQVATRIER